MGAGVVAGLYDCGAPGLRGELRRRGEHPDGVAVSFVKVVELQARGISAVSVDSGNEYSDVCRFLPPALRAVSHGHAASAT